MIENKIRFVVATRENKENFFNKTATGKSLKLYKYPFVEHMIFFENKKGLPTIYNEAIEKSKLDPAILVFIHDDVHIVDFFWDDNLINGLNNFDIIGLAGTKKRIPKQPSWCFEDTRYILKLENLSGIVAHGKGFPPDNINCYGSPWKEVKLLDGVFLAGSSKKLNTVGLMFDEQFDFHFYDLDFCRSAENLGLRMGTWPISIIHESIGEFNYSEWNNGYQKYLKKWEE